MGDNTAHRSWNSTRHGPEVAKPAAEVVALSCVMLVSDEEEDSAALSLELRRCLRNVRILVVSPSSAAQTEAAVDVCLVQLSNRGCQGLAYLPADEDSSIVFWADTLEGPQARAAAALGVSQILPKNCLVSWLSEALPALTLRAQSKRMLRRAEQQVPPVPSWSECAAQETLLPLPEAETLFRESYIRRLLTTTRSRKDAARLAGIPYRTFCDILKKLDIR